MVETTHDEPSGSSPVGLDSTVSLELDCFSRAFGYLQTVGAGEYHGSMRHLLMEKVS